MFVGKAGAYARVEQMKWGRILAFPTNIGLGWKDLLGTNTIAYYKK